MPITPKEDERRDIGMGQSRQPCGGAEPDLWAPNTRPLPTGKHHLHGKKGSSGKSCQEIHGRRPSESSKRECGRVGARRSSTSWYIVLFIAGILDSSSVI